MYKDYKTTKHTTKVAVQLSKMRASIKTIRAIADVVDSYPQGDERDKLFDDLSKEIVKIKSNLRRGRLQVAEVRLKAEDYKDGLN